MERYVSGDDPLAVMVSNLQKRLLAKAIAQAEGVRKWTETRRKGKARDMARYYRLKGDMR